VVEDIKDLVGGVYWRYAPIRMAFSEMGLSYMLHSEASCAYTWCEQTTDTLEDDQPANQGIFWGAAVDGSSMYCKIYLPTRWE
jgi:hypothetical protein